MNAFLLPPTAHSKAPFAIVSDCCPVGCSGDVFLIKSRRDGQIYSYCWTCGVMWQHPLAARWSDGYMNDYRDPEAHLPEGFYLPSAQEIESERLSDYVLRTIDDYYCRRHFSELYVMDKRLQLS